MAKIEKLDDAFDLAVRLNAIGAAALSAQMWLVRMLSPEETSPQYTVACVKNQIEIMNREMRYLNRDLKRAAR